MKIGIFVGMLIMCLVPTEAHNKIRSVTLDAAITIFGKVKDLATSEKKFDIVKVQKEKP